MNQAEQDRFDALLQDVIDSLPPRVAALVDEVPVVVMDKPSREMVELLRKDGTLGPDEDGSDLCGLHSGVGLTHRTVEDPGGWGGVGEGGGPEQIHLFREGILALASEDQGWKAEGIDDELYEEIRITLLHEIGHHFGLDEGDLDELGYA